MKFSVTTKLNGKPITSSSQLQRELKKSLEDDLAASVKRAAGPGVRVTKAPGGFKLQGSEASVKRAVKRLGK